MAQITLELSELTAKDVQTIKDWTCEKDTIFDCDCSENGGYMEYAVNAYIHTDNCSTNMVDHMDIVLTRLIEWLTEYGPIKVRGW